MRAKFSDWRVLAGSMLGAVLRDFFRALRSAPPGQRPYKELPSWPRRSLSSPLAFAAVTAVNPLGAFAVIPALKKKAYHGAAAASAPQAACGAGRK